jgi:hypothetical protein
MVLPRDIGWENAKHRFGLQPMIAIEPEKRVMSQFEFEL